ncbi:Esterase E4 [Chionoecetes opilio]|uniref:Carboxylic ester hydrolase n=1 Tax=Chionoecetes opilio TaxID=41210 RepID=A0A8J4YR21_CHIOP|nr:Esterase E4 [Chionoecetes opilio]
MVCTEADKMKSSAEMNDSYMIKKRYFRGLVGVAVGGVAVGVLTVILATTIVFIQRAYPKPLEDEEGDPVVSIAKGTLKGVRERSVGGRSILSFYAIPFARPPLGELRFQDPVEEEAWMGVRNASRQPEPCLQISFQNLKDGVMTEEHVVGSEDCLYLNVFTPKVGVGVEVPVMVFLHGGGYLAGAAHLFLPHLLLDHQVVLVVPQFRLGAIGFMSTEDDVMSGNYMLKDQLAALRWVRRHIRHFGGDPHRVTLFGQSAGGSSTNILVLSPKAQGLFSRVILHSGTVLSPFNLGRRHREVAEDTASRLPSGESENSPGGGLHKNGPLSLMLKDDDPDPLTKAAAIYQYYLGRDMDFELSDNLTQLYTDYFFGVPSDMVALAHAACARPYRQTFLFELTYRGERSVSDLSNATVGKDWVIHGDDLLYLFPVEALREGLQPLASSEDFALRDYMTKLWVNFAYTGNPTPDASLGFTWDAVEEDKLNYLALTPSPTMKPDYRSKVREFYRTVLPERNEFMKKLTALKRCMQLIE